MSKKTGLPARQFTLRNAYACSLFHTEVSAAALPANAQALARIAIRISCRLCVMPFSFHGNAQTFERSSNMHSLRFSQSLTWRSASSLATP